MQSDLSRSCDASCDDRLIVGAIVGWHIEPGRCSKGDTARAMKPGRYDQGDTAKAKWPGRYDQGDAARAMRPGRYGQGDTARAIRPGRYGHAAQVARLGGLAVRPWPFERAGGPGSIPDRKHLTAISL